MHIIHAVRDIYIVCYTRSTIYHSTYIYSHIGTILIIQGFSGTFITSEADMVLSRGHLFTYTDSTLPVLFVYPRLSRPPNRFFTYIYIIACSYMYLVFTPYTTVLFSPIAPCFIRYISFILYYIYTLYRLYSYFYITVPFIFLKLIYLFLYYSS